MNLCNNMSMCVTMGIMEFHGCLWEFVRVYGGFGSIWKPMGVWINMNSRWVCLCVVYRWYVHSEKKWFV